MNDRVVSSRASADVARHESENATTPTHGGLVRTVGMVVVALSALAQEYGSGINFVMPHSLAAYPAVENLVPLAMLVAGIILIPQVALFARYASVMPRAGSTYVWLTRGLGPYVGFPVAFLWLIGLCGTMGVVAYVVGTFFGDAAHAAGLAIPWFTSSAGHLVTGLGAIWLFAALHVSGVKNYGYLIYAAGALVTLAALVVIVTGFTGTSSDAVAQLAATTGIHPQPRIPHPSMAAFISVIGISMFAYGGLAASTSLGGEVVDARRNMPRGIIGGWAIALVLYTAVSYALFHAVPWWAALPVVGSGHGELLTTPALIGMLLPRAIAIALNVLVAVVVLKTLAPELLDASRFLFAWAEDGFIPRCFARTNRAGAPAAAVVFSALLASAFLIDAVFGGWQIGVALRAVSIALVFAMLGLATILLAWWPAWRRSHEFASPCTRGGFTKVMALCAVVIGAVLVAFVVHQPHAAWYLQPWFQLALGTIVAIFLTRAAHRRARHSRDGFAARFREPPSQ